MFEKENCNDLYGEYQDLFDIKLKSVLRLKSKNLRKKIFDNDRIALYSTIQKMSGKSKVCNCLVIDEIYWSTVRN